MPEKVLYAAAGPERLGLRSWLFRNDPDAFPDSDMWEIFVTMPDPPDDFEHQGATIGQALAQEYYYMNEARGGHNDGP